MRKLPLVWIAIEAVVVLQSASGCATVGRQWRFPLERPNHSSVTSTKTTNRPASSTSVPSRRPTEQIGHSISSSTGSRGAEQQRVSELIANSQLEPRAQSQSSQSIIDTADWEGGVYVGGGGTIHGWPVVIGSTGVIALPTPWTTLRCGVIGADNGGIGVGGIEGGVRLHAPTRFTPYVGLSSDLGFSGFHTGINHFAEVNGTGPHTFSKLAGLAAIVPEAGVSYWLNSSTRLNAGISYFVAGGQPDFLLYGLSMEFLVPDWQSYVYSSSRDPRRVPPETSDDDSSEPYFFEPKGLYDPLDLIRERLAKRALEKSGAPAELPQGDGGDETKGPQPVSPDLPSQPVPQSDL